MSLLCLIVKKKLGDTCLERVKQLRKHEPILLTILNFILEKVMTGRLSVKNGGETLKAQVNLK